MCILKSIITFIWNELQKQEQKLPVELTYSFLEWTDYSLLFCRDYLGAKSKAGLPTSCHTQILSKIGSLVAWAIYFPSLKILGASIHTDSHSISPLLT